MFESLSPSSCGRSQLPFVLSNRQCRRRYDFAGGVPIHLSFSRRADGKFVLSSRHPDLCATTPWPIRLCLVPQALCVLCARTYSTAFGFVLYHACGDSLDGNSKWVKTKSFEVYERREGDRTRCCATHQ